MELQCPYDEVTLKIALISASSKMASYQAEHGGEEAALKRIEEAFVGLTVIEEGVPLNAAVAAHNGISVEALINSPNYLTIKGEFVAMKVQQVLAKMGPEFGLDDKEAWAVLLAGRLM